jgi:hypothetical protein
MRNLIVLFVALIMVGCASAPTSTPTHTSTEIPSDTPTAMVNLPDLIVTRAQNSLEPRFCFGSYSQAKIIVFIHNQGIGQSGAFDVYINGEVVSYTESLPPDDEIELQADFGLSTTQIEVEIDPENLITESDESNNTFTGLVLTLTPPAPCTATPTP